MLTDEKIFTVFPDLYRGFGMTCVPVVLPGRLAQVAASAKILADAYKILKDL